MNAIVSALLAVSLTVATAADIRLAEDAARRDIAAGNLILRSYGLAGHSAWSDVLQERYGIRVRIVAGCVVNPKIVAETAAYNRIMQAEIEKRFGAGILEKVQRELSAEPRGGEMVRPASETQSSSGRRSAETKP